MSKKTLKSVKAKIRSALKQRVVVYCLSFVVFSLIIVGLVAWFNLGSDKTEETVITTPTCVQVEDNCFDVEIADTNEERIRGLSNRNSLPKNQGMLFIFEQIEEQCMVMKDMNFSLDIIWLNEHKKIIKTDENLSPDTYPELFCAEDIKYVLEVNEGFASQHGLKAGTTVQFE